MSKDISEYIRIDRRSATPISDQIRYELQNLIASKKVQSGETIEPIRVLAFRLNVLLEDVRKAYHSLIELHYLYMLPDGNYRVSFFELHNDLYKPFYIIIDQIAAMGMKVSIELIERKIIYPSKLEASRFGFSSTERLLYLKRLYYGDQQVFFMGEHYIPLHIFPMFEHEVKGDERLYPLMSELGKVEMKQASRMGESCVMDQKLAKLFSLKVGSPYLKVDSKMYDQLHRQIEFSSICLLANYSIELKVSRNQLFFNS